MSSSIRPCSIITDSRSNNMRRFVWLFALFGVLALPTSAVARHHHHKRHVHAAASPPEFVVAPVLSGTSAPGNVMHTTLGKWRHRPRHFAVYWQLCTNPLPAGNVTGYCPTVGQGRSYLVTSNDAGGYLRSVVHAFNRAGSESAASATTLVSDGSSPPPPPPPPPGAAPANLVQPVISGRTESGSTLSTDTGSWNGDQPMSFTYQWQDCGQASCSDIAGATTRSYTLQSSDVGSNIDVIVTAKNAAGRSSAASEPVGPVTSPSTPPPPPPPPPPPAGTTTIYFQNASDSGISDSAVQAALSEIQQDVNTTAVAQWNEPQIQFQLVPANETVPCTDLSQNCMVEYLLSTNSPTISSCGCGGFHDFNENGAGPVPTAFNGAFTTGSNFPAPNPWQEVVSHETKEMVVDPVVSHMLDNVPCGACVASSVNWLVEVGDPVEVTRYYVTDGVTNEDNVLEAWYDNPNSSPWDTRNTTSWQVLGGKGEAFYQVPGDSSGTWWEYLNRAGSISLSHSIKLGRHRPLLKAAR